MSLIQRIARCMEEFAPLALAETAWDNVGILVEAPEINYGGKDDAVMLTIDLSQGVMEECMKYHVNTIICYHPIIFKPIKSLSLDDYKQSIIIRAIQAGISIYSPHTALDACSGGINDWLAEGIGLGLKMAIKPSISYPDGNIGQGRLLILNEPRPISNIVEKIKTHLELQHVRLGKAFGGTELIRKIAICAGSGGQILHNVDADLYLTGEMSHHDVLHANAQNIHVILCEHSNTERGFLRAVLQQYLQRSLGNNVRILCSTTDKDPLIVN